MAKKIVVLCGDSPSERSGLQVVALTQAKALQRRGLEVSIFCRGQETESKVIEGVLTNSFRYSNSPSSLSNFINMRFSCKKAWKLFYGHNGPDIVHGHDYLTYYFILSEIFGGTRKVFTIHDPLVYHQAMLGKGRHYPKTSFLKYIERTVHNKSDSILAISKYTIDRISSQTIKPPTIISNWVDTNRFRLPEDRNLVRMALGIEQNEFVVFSVRALEPRMGLDNLIVGFAQASGLLPKSKLLIGGRGPMKESLQFTINSLGINNISLLGFLPDEQLVLWYQAADVVIIPSLDGEGFGLPIIEAMACGVPVLGTPVCAIPEVLSGVNDRLLAGTTPNDIASGLIEFYNLWKEGAINAEKERQYVVDNFPEDKLICLLMDAYGV